MHTLSTPVVIRATRDSEPKRVSRCVTLRALPVVMKVMSSTVRDVVDVRRNLLSEGDDDQRFMVILTNVSNAERFSTLVSALACISKVRARWM